MHAAAPAIVYYGDDFTGATDTLGTAARAGLRTLLFLQVPTAQQLADAGPLDCLGIAGAARAMNPEEMREALAPVSALFQQLGARVLHYKLCSTFDSAPAVGNIGVAVQTLRDAVPGMRTAIVGGQPDLGRYCLFGNLFAAAGSGGEVHRIDRHPTMSQHPVTPMHEADLRQHLALQGLADLQLLPWTAHAGGGAALHETFQQLQASAADGVLFDVSSNADLARIGDLLWRHASRAPLLVAGASSVAQALAPQITRREVTPLPVSRARGPVLVLAGSLSPVTAGQVAAAVSYEKIWLDPVQLAGSAGYRAEAARRLNGSLAAGTNVLACTVRPGDRSASGDTVGSRALAEAGGDLLSRVLTATPLSRVGVAGGDTSSHAVQALDAWGLSYLAALSPGVALCRLHSTAPGLDGLEIALKGGQMGGVDFFERLLYGTA
ncbi:MAG: four-carbon acid sugar kinase family protein [Variovorax sp.]|nr:MAG: four-carbon acid sugar kinase family protein [Variovorax sp.]